MARIEIRVKRSQGLTPDCFSRARCRVRSVRGCALSAADCSENRESEAAGPQAQGCGSPRSLGVPSSWRPEDTDSCSVLKTRGVPPGSTVVSSDEQSINFLIWKFARYHRQHKCLGNGLRV